MISGSVERLPGNSVAYRRSQPFDAEKKAHGCTFLIGKTLAALGAVAVGALGTVAILAPAATSRGYGFVAEDPAGLAFVRATGARDLVLGAILASGALREDAASLGATLLCCSLVGLADFLIVLSNEASDVRPYLALHASGCAVCVGVAFLIYRGI